MKRPNSLDLLVAMAALATGSNPPVAYDTPKSWKPSFTEEELAYIRQLPKKEKKAAVEALRQKYLLESKKKK